MPCCCGKNSGAAPPGKDGVLPGTAADSTAEKLLNALFAAPAARALRCACACLHDEEGMCSPKNCETMCRVRYYTWLRNR
jgi:hypothetical protein